MDERKFVIGMYNKRKYLLLSTQTHLLIILLLYFSYY